VTSRDWALILLLAAAIGFVVLVGLFALLAWLGLFGRDEWD
jgi:hypothetical protein